MKKRRLLLTLIGLSLVSMTRADAPVPEWYHAIDYFSSLFDPARVLTPLHDALAKFELVFTAMGFAAVIISATLKIARARTSHESMGWIASTMLAVAFMAIGPSVGKKVFDAADEVATWSGYDMFDALTTTWSHVLLVMPPQSPSKQVLDVSDAAKKAESPSVPTAGPAPEEHWWDSAVGWMVSSWDSLKDSVAGMFAAFQSVATTVLVTLMLLGTCLFMIIACIIILLGVFAREILHSTMDIFLPCMIGMLTLDFMRGAASTFLIRYVTIAFWPVAWALGNAIATSLLESVGRWAVNASTSVLAAVSIIPVSDTIPRLGPATAGLVAAAATHMAWGLMFCILFAIIFCGIMMIASAVLSPLALSNVFTKGASFAGGLLRSSAVGTALAGGALASGGAGAVASGAAAGAASSFGGIASSIASKGAAGLNSIGGRLSGMAAAGGPLGRLAAAGASMMGRAASMLETAGRGTEQTAGAIAGAMSPTSLSGRGLATMMDTAGSLMSGAASMIPDEQGVGAASAVFTRAAGQRTGRAVARSFRWANDRVRN